MIKKLSFIFLLFALMLTALSITLTMVDTSSVRISGRVLPIKVSAIDSMSIYKGEKVLATFNKDGRGKWKVEIPELGARKYSADRVIIEELLAFVNRAEMLPVQQVTFAQSGISGNNKFQFVVRVGEEAFSVYLGEYSSDGKFRYYSADSDIKRVFKVDRDLVKVFDRNPEDYRSLDVVDFGVNPPNEIVVYPGDGADKLVMEGSNIGWVVKKPMSWPASNNAVSRLLRVLTMLRAKEIADKEFTPTSETPYMKFKNDVGTTTLWLFGKTGDDLVYIKSSDRDEVYEVDGAFALEFARAAFRNYRRRVLNLIGEREISSIKLNNSKKQRLVFSKLQGGSWRAKGAYDFAVEKDSVDGLEKIFKGLVVKDVFSVQSAQGLNRKFENPDMQVTAYDAGGAAIVEISLVRQEVAAPLRGPDRIFAKISGRSQIVELEPVIGEYLLSDFKLYRSKVLYFIDFREIHSIEIISPEFTREYWRNSDTQYQMVKPETKMLSEKGNWEFLSLVRDLAKLRCEGYVPGKNLKNIDLGLDQPSLKTILTMRSNIDKNSVDKKKIELIVGNSLVLNDLSGGVERKTYYYARLKNSDDVFILNKKLIDALLIGYK